MTATAEKTCSACGNLLPVDAFSVRTDRPGHCRTRCRRCWSLYMRRYRARQQDKLLHGFCRRAANAQTNRQAVRLANQFTRRFGARRFANLLVGYAESLANRRPGNRAIFTALKAIYRTCFAPPLG